eukprot:CAMPEP_0113491714 /NCGR_PEP_ID=MMETSP0014_2-20120614/27697_1 /TAXON_ID=2857 /ORGANISM="Nitzschia sp." /LENGTH=178 /DNA_ID=CAMNT_0000385511 /DNA_START=28 /DNA_END=560 /DNA_ORIENTATION=+ /assembly_acc=CAM_ASM_000159
MAMMGTTTHAFTVVGGGHGTTRVKTAATNTILKMSSSTATATTTTDANSSAASDFGSAMPEEVDPHDIIGVEPEKLALGIDPHEFLEWVGTRNDLIDKFQKDNPDYKTDRIEIEVDKFMMDSEMSNGYIKYLKDIKVNAATPRNYEAELEAELSISNPKTAATYAAWLIGGASFGSVR